MKEYPTSLTELDREAWALYLVGTMIMTTLYHDPLRVLGYIRTKTFMGSRRTEPVFVVGLDGATTLDVCLHSVIGIATKVAAEERMAIAV